MEMQELSGVTIIGFKAKEVAKQSAVWPALKKPRYLLNNFSLGFSKLELPHNRPSPLYVHDETDPTFDTLNNQILFGGVCPQNYSVVAKRYLYFTPKIIEMANHF